MKFVNQDVKYVNHMGTDKTVVDAARVSFDQDDSTRPFDLEKDSKLINYLAKHNHWSPFAHTTLQLKIRAPIFVARQLVKHQVGGVWNEVSRRYVSDEPEFFMPTSWREAPDPKKAKQGSAGDLAGGVQMILNRSLTNHTEQCLQLYKNLLGSGVAPEQARMVLPINTHTEWYWTGSLVFWARVCKLRLDSHSQGETTELVRGISPIAEKYFPVSWKALMEA